MLLSKWIEKNGGTGKTAELMGEQRGTVNAWLRGVAMPRPLKMKMIYGLSCGRVKYADMIDEYLEKNMAIRKGKTGTNKSKRN